MTEEGINKDRGPLDREWISLAALQLIDSNGLGGLSMRKLGAELGVEAMSLYHYVDNKDDLLDLVLDRLYAEIDLPLDVAPQDWETAIRRGLTAFYSVLTAHPSAIELFTSRPARTTEALRVAYWARQRFHLVGMSPTDSSVALHFAVSFVIGHVATEFGTMTQLRDGREVDLDQVDDPDMVNFLQSAREVTPEQQFAAGLDMVVAGLKTQYRLT